MQYSLSAQKYVDVHVELYEQPCLSLSLFLPDSVPRSLSLSLSLTHFIYVVCPEPIKQSSTTWQLIHSFGFCSLTQTHTHRSCGYLM